MIGENMRKSKRLELLPPYLFAEIDRKKQEIKDKGVEILDFGVGDPDLPTPQFVIEAMKQALDDPKTHDYPPYQGTREFREAVSFYYDKRFGIKLDPDKEVLSLIGSKEGIAHITFAFVDNNDYVLVPDPGYPVYKVSTIIAGGIPYSVPLLEKNKYLPDISTIPSEIAKKTKLFYLNYPNNPTGAIADLKKFEEIIEFAKTYDILICHDLAYSEICFDDYKAPSFLEIKGAIDHVIEFNSLSKMFNMTGWRIAMAVGNSDAVQALGKIKTNIDSGVFKAIQRAGTIALTSSWNHLPEINSIYKGRRDILTKALIELGWDIQPPKATFYVWIPVPKIIILLVLQIFY